MAKNQALLNALIKAKSYENRQDYKKALDAILHCDPARRADGFREAVILHKKFWNSLSVNIAPDDTANADGFLAPNGTVVSDSIQNLYQRASINRILLGLSSADKALLDSIIVARDIPELQVLLVTPEGKKLFG